MHRTGLSSLRVFIGSIATLMAAGALLLIPHTAHAADACGVYSSALAVPSGFGAAFNTISTSKETLLQSSCTEAGYTAEVGSAQTTAANFAVYEKGYSWNGTEWAEFALAPNGRTLTGAFVLGNARSAVTLSYSGDNTYWVSFVCVLQDNAWKCGCRDMACSAPFWNLQVAQKPPAATPPPTGWSVDGCNNLKIGQLGVGKAINMVVPVTAARPSSNSVPAHFNWSFNSGGGDAYCGKFANGDYWIAPKGASSVTITGLTTNNGKVTADANPIPEKTGVMDGATKRYGNHDAGQNIVTQLPRSYSTITSILAAKQRNESVAGCGTPGITGGCIDAYHIVTILPNVPANNGANTIRPNITGQTKVTLTLYDFDFSRMPNTSIVGGTDAAGIERIRQRYSHSTGIFGLHFQDIYTSEGNRAFRPHILHDNYAARMAQSELNPDVLTLLSGGNTVQEKLPALAAMISYGLDIYHSRFSAPPEYQGRRGWASGAGQHVGAFLPPLFMAALLKDPTYANVLKQVGPKAHSDNDMERGPQELRQVYPGRNSGTLLWGDIGAEYGILTKPSALEERYYWANFYKSKCWTGSSSCSPVNASSRDPYRYVDGGAEAFPGHGYIQIAWDSLRGLAGISCIMPEIGEIMNYPQLLQWIDRMVDNGLQAMPDECARPPADENSNCSPWDNNGHGANCKYFRKTWGPDPNKPGDCIKGGAGPRFSHRHGVEFSPQASYLTGSIESNWATIRALCK